MIGSLIIMKLKYKKKINFFTRYLVNANLFAHDTQRILWHVK